MKTITIIVFLLLTHLLNGQIMITKYFCLHDSVAGFNKKKDGEKDGWWKTYYINGNVKKLSFYVNGKKNDREVVFYRDGQLKKTIIYKNGKKNGASCFYVKAIYGIFNQKRLSDPPFDCDLYENGKKIKKMDPPSGGYHSY